jgi:alanyl-tRNA synthetase
VTDEEIAKVEMLVNAKIRENIALEEMRNIPIDEARKLGAMALFSEKYGDTVRAIKFGTSVELCGGTHAKATGQLGFFKITSEASASAGIRRIEAVTADRAEELVNDMSFLLRQLAEMLKAPSNAAIAKSIETLIRNNQKLTEQGNKLIESMMTVERNNLKANIEEIGNNNLLVAEIKPIFADKLKDIMFQIRNEFENIVIVLGINVNDKPQLAIIASDNLIKDKSINAVEAIKAIAKHIQGGGGGQAFFATAGGKNAAGLDAALREAKYYFTDKLK